MKFFVIFVILAGLVAILRIVLKKSATTDNKPAISKYLAGMKDFLSTKEFMGVDGASGIAIDEKSRKICLISNKGRFFSRVISHQEILSTEIVEDGYQIAKVSRRSLVDESIQEEMELEDTGESSSEVSDTDNKTATHDLHHTVGKIALNVIVANMQDPIHTVVFSDNASERGSVNYNISLTAARQWHSRLCILIQQADNEDENSINQVDNANESPYVADEISKLAELVKNGILTEEEFNLQKGKLLKLS